jgi:sulfate adenylyltransferase
MGTTKSDDIPGNVRMECYKTLIENYYPKSHVLLSIMPVNMRYAGPKEAIMHAIVRKNYGCTHLLWVVTMQGWEILYGTYDAQKIFEILILTNLDSPFFLTILSIAVLVEIWLQ